MLSHLSELFLTAVHSESNSSDTDNPALAALRTACAHHIGTVLTTLAKAIHSSSLYVHSESATPLRCDHMLACLLLAHATTNSSSNSISSAFDAACVARMDVWDAHDQACFHEFTAQIQDMAHAEYSKLKARAPPNADAKSLRKDFWMALVRARCLQLVRHRTCSLPASVEALELNGLDKVSKKCPLTHLHLTRCRGPLHSPWMQATYANNTTCPSPLPVGPSPHLLLQGRLA